MSSNVLGKALKAILTEKLVALKKTHDILELYPLCALFFTMILTV